MVLRTQKVLDAEPGNYAAWFGCDDVPAGVSLVVALLDEEPLFSFGPRAGSDEREAAAKFLAVQPNLNFTITQGVGHGHFVTAIVDAEVSV